MNDKTMTRFMSVGLTLCFLAAIMIVLYRPAKAEPYAGLSISTSTGEIGANDDYIKDKGIIAGAFIGHNYRFKNGAMLGLEGDLNWSGVTGNLKDNGARVTATSGYTGSVRARAGAYLTDDFLIYATGGLAFDDKTIKAVVDNQTAKKSKVNLGLTLGAGVEYAMTNTLSLRGEVRHTQYADFDFFGQNLDSSATTVGAGIVFKLN